MPERIIWLPHPYDRVARLMMILRQECPWDQQKTLRRASLLRRDSQ